MTSDEQEFSSPGWDAIDSALRPIYGSEEPRHWGTVISWELGGPDPIRGISAYRGRKQPDHWHFITYGFTELYQKESENSKVSGWGFELTFRLASRPDEEPPMWVLSFLQNLGRYVFNTGNVFGVGHTLPLNGPITFDRPTKVRAVSFARDPELHSGESSNGYFDFLQIVGLTDDELEAVQSWNAAQFLTLAAKHNEMLVTDVDRESWLLDPSFARAVSERTKAEGASAVSLSCDHARAEVHASTCTIFLGQNPARDLKRRLPGRLPFGRPFSVLTPDCELRFSPADRFDFQTLPGGVELLVPNDAVDDLVELLTEVPSRGTASSLPGLTIVIEPSVIRGADGKAASDTSTSDGS